MIYSRYRKTDWWRRLASRLALAEDTVVVSEFRNDADVYVMPSFYRWMCRPDNETAAWAAFGEAGCEEIRMRCRFLRQFDPQVALKMVGAMLRALVDIIDQEQPDLLLSFCIDYYAVDILDRILSARGIKYVGISGAPIAGQTLVTTRGEHNQVREPDFDEVATTFQSVTSDSFAPFLPTRPHYGPFEFAKKYAHYTARAPAFRAIGLWNRDSLNMHYWLSRPDCGWRMRIRDYGVVRHFNADWKRVAHEHPVERRIFVALGVYPESTIDYWVRSRSLLDYHATLIDVVATFSAAGYLVLVKDHPNMFGFQRIELVEQLAAIDRVVFVPYEVPSQTLMAETRGTFTLAGTVGMQAALAGRVSIVTDPYYFVDGAFLRLEARPDIATLPRRVEGFVLPDEERRQEIVRQVLRTCIPADLFESWREFGQRKGSDGPHMTQLATSIDKYVPSLIGS